MYALTGASGQLGRLVLQHLLTLIPANQIIATTRHPEKLAEFKARGVVVRRADFSVPTTLSVAFAGATRLLIISTDAIGHRTEQHRAVVEAAVSAGAQHITYTSCPDASVDASRPIHQREHGLTEAALAASSVAWIALRNHEYAEVLPYLMSMLRTGDHMLIPEGGGKPVWVTRQDCARTAAFALAGKTALSGPVDVTGPERLGLMEIAHRWSSINDRVVTARVVPDHELLARIIAKGVPEQAAAGAVRIAIGVAREGTSIVSPIVEQATGTKASPVDVVLRAYQI